MSSGAAPRPSVVERFRRELFERPEHNLAALDGLRGFAISIVVLWHCAIFSGAYTEEAEATGRLQTWRALVNGGWSGVDVFFVLSGFLIGRILVTSLARDGSLHWRRFFQRRVARIFPAYYLVLTLALFVIAPPMPGSFPILFGTHDWRVLGSGAWANYLYLSNYVQPGSAPNLLSWGWSLCVEEHFYLLLPPVLWALFRVRSRRWRAALLGAVVLGPLAGRCLQYLADPSTRLLDGFYYYSHNRFDELLVGVAVAYAFVLYRERLRSAVLRAGAWLAPFGLSCMASVWLSGGTTEGGGFAVVAQFSLMALGGACLVLAGLFLEDPISRCFAHRAWYPLARVSYGAYLIHPFVIVGLLSLHRVAAPSAPVDGVRFVGLVAGTFLLTSLLAALMFVLWERPFLARAAASTRAGASGPDDHP